MLARRPMRLPRGVRGFTLIEAAVVAAIAAILATVALPQMEHTMARWRLQAAAHHLAADMAEARSEAARRGIPLQVHTSAGPQWCWNVTAASACPCDSEQPCHLRRVTAAEYRGVHFDESASVRMTPQAQARASVTLLGLHNDHGDRLRLSIHPSGRARVCSPDGGTAAVPAC